MAERSAAMSEDKRIAFRVGVNVGDIIIDGDDIFGDGVNMAAEGDGIELQVPLKLFKRSLAFPDQLLKLSFAWSFSAPKFIFHPGQFSFDSLD